MSWGQKYLLPALEISRFGSNYFNSQWEKEVLQWLHTCQTEPLPQRTLTSERIFQLKLTISCIHFLLFPLHLFAEVLPTKPAQRERNDLTFESFAEQNVRLTCQTLNPSPSWAPSSFFCCFFSRKCRFSALADNNTQTQGCFFNSV